jgi:hypothetical protein
MVHMTGDHVGYRFNSPVGMHGESLHIIRWITGSKMIEQQKRIDMIQFARRDTSNESHPGTFHDRPGLNDSDYFSGLFVHFFSLCLSFPFESQFFAQTPQSILFSRRQYSQLFCDNGGMGGEYFVDEVVAFSGQMNDKKPAVSFIALTPYPSGFFEVVDYHRNIAAASEDFLPDFPLGQGA